MYAEVFDLQASLFKALAHPKRLEILQLLRDQELPVSDIYAMLDLPQANISQHLTVMREANIVGSRRTGKQIYYSLSGPKILAAVDLFREHLIDENKNSQLGHELSLNMSELLPLTHDPICGMRISLNTAAFVFKHNGRNHYFCASGCLKNFKSNPTQFLKE